MKKLVLLLVLFSIFSLCFVSCNGEDEDPPADRIVGRWQFDKVGAIIDGEEYLTPFEHQCSSKKDNMEFFEGGEFNNSQYWADCSQYGGEGSWTLDRNTVTVVMADETLIWEIRALDSSMLKLYGNIGDGSNEKYLMVFQRI